LGVPWASQDQWKSKLDGDLTWAPWALPDLSKGETPALPQVTGGKASLAVNGEGASTRSASADGLSVEEARSGKTALNGGGAVTNGQLSGKGTADLSSKRTSTYAGTVGAEGVKGKETDLAALKGSLERSGGQTRYDVDGAWSREGSRSGETTRADGRDTVNTGFAADVKTALSNQDGVRKGQLEAGLRRSHDAQHHTQTATGLSDVATASLASGRAALDVRDGEVAGAVEGKVNASRVASGTEAIADGSRTHASTLTADAKGALRRANGVTAGNVEGKASGDWSGRTEQKSATGSHIGEHAVQAQVGGAASGTPGAINGGLTAALGGSFRSADKVLTDTGSVESGLTHGGKASGALNRADGALSGQAQGTYSLKGDRTVSSSADGVDHTLAQTYGGDATGGLAWADGQLRYNGKGGVSGSDSRTTVSRTADGEDRLRLGHSGGLSGSLAETGTGLTGTLDTAYAFDRERARTSAAGTETEKTHAGLNTARVFGGDQAGVRMKGEASHNLRSEQRSAIEGGTAARSASHGFTAAGELLSLDSGARTGGVNAGYTGSLEEAVSTRSADGQHSVEGKNSVTGGVTAGATRTADGTALSAGGQLQTRASAKTVDAIEGGTQTGALLREGGLTGSLNRAADGSLRGKADGSYAISGQRVTHTELDGLTRDATTAGGAKVKTSLEGGPDGLRQTRGAEAALNHKVATTRVGEGGTVTTELGAGLTAAGSQTTAAAGEARGDAKAALAINGSRTSVQTGEGGTTRSTLAGSGKVEGTLVQQPDGTLVRAVGGQSTLSGSRSQETTAGDLTTRSTLGAELAGQGSLTEGQGGSGKASLGVNGSRQTVLKTADGSVTTDLSGKAGLEGSLAQQADGTRAGAGGVTLGAGYKQVATSTQGDTEHKRTTGLDLAAQGALTADQGRNGKVTLGAGNTVETTTRTATGTQSATVADRIDLSGTGTRALGADGKPVTTVGGTLAVGRDTRNASTRTAANGAVTTTAATTSTKGTASAETGKGLTLGATRSEGSSSRTVEGATTTTSSDNKAQSVALNAKDGLTAKQTTDHTGRQSVTTLNAANNTTLTTTAGLSRTEVGAGVKKDENGNVVASANAKGSATLYGQQVATNLANGGTASAGYKVGDASAQADASATLTKDQVKVKGTAGAKVSLVEGNAKIEAPVFGWSLWGEDFSVRVSAAVSAGVLAEANGQIDLNIAKGGDQLGVTVGGGGHAFAGAKAGVEVAAALDWKRKPDYSADIIKLCKSVPGSVDDWIVDRMPAEFWTQFSQTAIGSGSTSIIDAKAGLTGSAGIGGDASFAMGLQGGKINVSGELSGTIGLGAGVKTDLQLDSFAGVRLLGVYGMRGLTWITDKIKSAGSWMWGLIGQLRQQTDAWMEAKKKEGGLSGGLASVTDFFGDKVFNLW
jgi:hypothetical protein